MQLSYGSLIVNLLNLQDLMCNWGKLKEKLHVLLLTLKTNLYIVVQDKGMS